MLGGSSTGEDICIHVYIYIYIYIYIRYRALCGWVWHDKRGVVYEKGVISLGVN